MVARSTESVRDRLSIVDYCNDGGLVARSSFREDRQVTEEQYGQGPSRPGERASCTIDRHLCLVRKPPGDQPSLQRRLISLLDSGGRVHACYQDCASANRVRMRCVGHDSQHTNVDCSRSPSGDSQPSTACCERPVSMGPDDSEPTQQHLTRFGGPADMPWRAGRSSPYFLFRMPAREPLFSRRGPDNTDGQSKVYIHPCVTAQTDRKSCSSPYLYFTLDSGI